MNLLDPARSSAGVSRRGATLLAAYLLVAGGLTLASSWLHQRLKVETGLTQSFYRGTDFESPPLFRRTAPEVSLAFLAQEPDLPRRFFSVQWEGFWYAANDGIVEFFLESTDRAVLWVDGKIVLERHAAVGFQKTSRRLPLRTGFHRLRVDYVQHDGRSHLNAQWAPAGMAARRFDPDTLFPVRPDPERLLANQRLWTVRALVATAWIAPPLILVVMTAGPLLLRLASGATREQLWQAGGLSVLVAFLVSLGGPYYTHHLPLTLLAVGLAGLYLLWPREVPATRRAQFLYWAVCVALLVGLDLNSGVAGGMNDFHKAQYRAGVYILNSPAYAYDEICGAYAYLPFSAILFVPFGWFPRETADLLYTMVGRLTVLATAYGLVAFFQVTGWKRWLLLILIAFNGPLDRILWLGNSTHFILLLLLVAVYALETKRPLWTGVLLGLAPLLKPSMGLLGIYFLVRRDWRVAVAWGATLGGAVLLSLLLFGYELNAFWWDTCIRQFQGGAIPAFRAQSIDGFLARQWIAGSNVYEWAAVAVDSSFRVLHYGAVLLVMGPALLAAWRTRAEPGTTYLELFMFLCAAILVSPISWAHYYVFLLLPIAFYAGGRFPRSSPPGRGTGLMTAVFVLAVILFSVPETLSVTLFRTHQSDLTRLVLSHYFFGGVLFYLFLIAQRFIVAQPAQPPVGGISGPPSGNGTPGSRHRDRTNVRTPEP